MKKILILFLPVFLCTAFFFLWLAPKYTVPILMYHSIDYGEGSFFVKPENFAKQMEYIKKNGYQVITLDELVLSLRNKTILKKNKVAITFDDGYRNNFQYAYPVLKKFGYPATIFLVTDFTGVKPGFLNWDEVVEMSKNKIAFGAHTKSHFYFGGQIDAKAAQEEIVGPKKLIEEKTGRPVKFFCYPSGAFTEPVKQLVAQAGYQGACTTNRGFVKFNRDVYELKRIKVTNSDTVKPFSFPAKLSGYYNIFKRNRNPY